MKPMLLTFTEIHGVDSSRPNASDLCQSKSASIQAGGDVQPEQRPDQHGRERCFQSNDM